MPTKIEPPAIQTVKSDIELFARAYFNIELTSMQVKVIDAIASGKVKELRVSRRAGIATANKIVRAYIAEGLRPGGRVRLPMHPLPPRQKPLKGVTQAGRILNAIKQPGGAYNFQLSRIALKYTSVISDLRKDGHNIEAQRQYNKKGKATDTWRYVCYE